MIVSYTVNQSVRATDRQMVSGIFTIIMNILYGLNLRYYTGANIIKTELIRKTPMHTDGHFYMPSLIVRLVKQGYSYKHVPNRIRKSEGSNLYKLKNVISIVKEFIRLFIEVNIANRSKYNKKLVMLS